MLVDAATDGGRQLGNLEGQVHVTNGLPIHVELLQDVKVEVGLLGTNARDDGSKAGLRAQARHGIDGTIDNVGACLSGGDHGSNTGSGSIVAMYVNDCFGELGTKSGDKDLGGTRSKKSGHVLHGERMRAHLHQFVGICEVIIEVVLVAWNVLGDISSVAKDGLDEASRGGSGLDADSHVLGVVQGVKDTENIHAGLICLLAEGIDDIVGIRRVSDGIGTSQKHLEAYIRHLGSEGLQSSPGTFMEEPHRHIEGGTAPHFKTEDVLRSSVRPVGGLSCFEHIDSPHTSGQETLMSITPGSIGEEDTVVLPNGARHGLGTLLSENMTEMRRRETGVLLTQDIVNGIKVRRGHVVERNDLRLLGVGTEDLWVAVDRNVRNVLQVGFEIVELLIGRSERLLIKRIMRDNLDIEQRGIILDEI
mmetsp:Transcript_28445/g.66756  ORF Transcript_28445/g.66756 Transcript_28445/m.66756 type:complete len:419 (-) Transcript_28445:1502-2758(-)